MEPGGDPAGARGQAEVVEPAQLDQPAPALDDPAGRFGIVEDLVEQCAPAFLEGELALELVEHPESGRQTGLHGIVVQDPAGEGVQRADRGVVEGVEREVHPLGVDRVVGIGLCRDQLGPQAMAQLGGRLLGERDGGDRADLDTARHERHDPTDQAAGLARTRPRLDEQIGAEIGGDRQPVGAIGQRVVLAHDAAPWSRLGGLVLGEPRGKPRIELLQLPLAESFGHAEPVGLAVVAIDAELPFRDAWRGGEQAGFDRFDEMTEIVGDTAPHRVVERVSVAPIVALVEEVVLGQHTGRSLGLVAEHRQRGGSVGGQLELGATLGRVIGSDVFEIDIAARLVVHHHELAGSAPIDAIDRPADGQPATFRQRQRDGPVGPEPQLGADDLDTALGGGDAVAGEPVQQFGQHRPAIEAPVCGTAGAAGALELVGDLVVQRHQASRVDRLPPLGPGLRQCTRRGSRG